MGTAAHLRINTVFRWVHYGGPPNFAVNKWKITKKKEDNKLNELINEKINKIISDE